MHSFLNRFCAGIFALCLCFLCASGQAANPTPPEMRLGDAIKPLAYDAALTIVPSADGFEGRIAIDIEILQSRDFYWINGTDLTIASVNLQIGGKTLTPVLVDGNQHFIGLRFADKLPLGKGRLSFVYAGQFSGKNTSGLFKQRDRDQWYVFSQFESTSARRAFPCFDEPHWKTPWTLALTVKRDHVAVANMPSVAEENLGTDMKLVRFATTPPLPSYLIALGVGPFDVVDGGTAGLNRTPLRYITPKGRAAEAAYAAKVTPRVLGLLEDYFGQPYPFPKLDSLAIPVTVDFGAMENVGLITYRANLLLALPGGDDESFRQHYVSVAAHEIAHQWFGDLVTMRWWNDLWLNESFATWMALKVYGQFDPAWNAHSDDVAERMRALETDRLRSTRQIRQAIEKHDDLANAFDRITYNKGGSVLKMFEAWLGEQAFRDGVRRYLRRHEFGSATAEDFFAALLESNPELAKAFSSFVVQPGVPLVSMALDCRGKPSLRLKQRRFLPGAPQPAASARQRWSIPVCVRYQGQKSEQPFCSILHQDSALIRLPDATACPSWLLPNPGGSGYYLPLLDDAMMAKLQKISLTANETVSLLAEQTMLARSGVLPWPRMLALAAHYAKDERPEVALAAVEAVALMPAAMLDAESLLRRASWVRAHFGARALGMGWQTGAKDGDTTQKLRVALLPLVANLGADQQLRAEARSLALDWLGGKSKDAPGVMLPPVLASAAYSGDQAVLDAMLAMAAVSPSNGDRNAIFNAMGWFADPALLQQAFSQFLGDKFDPREMLSMFKTAGKEADHGPQLQEFIRLHIDAMLIKLPDDFASNLLHWGHGLCTKNQRNAFGDFFARRAAKDPGGARNLAQALETIDICLAMRVAQDADVKRFFARQ